MTVYIENLQDKIQLDEDTVSLINVAVNLSLKNEKFTIPCEVSIFIVDDERIKEINNEYRNIDKSTDVLSFPIVDMVDGKINKNEGDFDLDSNTLVLGDIIISIETTIRQANEFGHSMERELAFLTTHGMFHLLGYDHENGRDGKMMFGKQEYILKEMGLVRQI